MLFAPGGRATVGMAVGRRGTGNGVKGVDVGGRVRPLVPAGDVGEAVGGGDQGDGAKRRMKSEAVMRIGTWVINMAVAKTANSVW
jgi:hypothetical protein